MRDCQRLVPRPSDGSDLIVGSKDLDVAPALVGKLGYAVLQLLPSRASSSKVNSRFRYRSS